MKKKFIKKILIALGAFFLFAGIGIGCVCWNYYKTVLKEDDQVKVVIAAHNGGQLCNQLWQFAHLAAFCKEQGYELYNPAFFRYAKYFEHFHDDVRISPTRPFKVYLPHIQEVQRRAHRILTHVLKTRFLENRHTPETVLSLTPSTGYFPELKAGRHFFFHWQLFDPKGLEQQGDYVREILKPKACYQRKIDLFWQSIDPSRLIVGVHIRHGDYRVWSQGDYFFTVEKYREHMQKIAHHYAELHPLFIIYSNEPRSLDEFPGLDIKISHGNLVEDLYSMASCDLIIGVSPSTYSGWAAWYGKTLRYEMDKEPDLALFDSKVKNKKW